MKSPASRHAASLCRISRQPPRRFPSLCIASLFILAVLSSGLRAGDSPTPHPASDEPLPPDILSVALVAEDDQEATIEITLKPSANGDVELSIPAGAVPAVAGLPAQATPLRVAKNSPSRVDRYRFDRSHGQYRRLSFRAVVKDAEGRIVTDVTKVLELNKDKKPKPAPGLARVPVVIETPGGRKIVEYMTRAEAARRGLTPAAQPAPAPPAEGPTTDTDTNSNEVAD